MELQVARPLVLNWTVLITLLCSQKPISPQTTTAVPALYYVRLLNGSKPRNLFSTRQNFGACRGACAGFSLRTARRPQNVPVAPSI